jgi:hypothetical protein
MTSVTNQNAAKRNSWAVHAFLFCVPRSATMSTLHAHSATDARRFELLFVSLFD